jgi:hypothetical protein
MRKLTLIVLHAGALVAAFELVGSIRVTPASA